LPCSASSASSPCPARRKACGEAPLPDNGMASVPVRPAGVPALTRRGVARAGRPGAQAALPSRDFTRQRAKPAGSRPLLAAPRAGAFLPCREIPAAEALRDRMREAGPRQPASPNGLFAEDQTSDEGGPGPACFQAGADAGALDAFRARGGTAAPSAVVFLASAFRFGGAP
jgi:hypothetical protein